MLDTYPSVTFASLNWENYNVLEDPIVNSRNKLRQIFFWIYTLPPKLKKWIHFQYPFSFYKQSPLLIEELSVHPFFVISCILYSKLWFWKPLSFILSKLASWIAKKSGDSLSKVIKISSFFYEILLFPLFYDIK